MAGSFRFVEDVALADAAFDVVADSPSELFVAAAHAVAETVADRATVGTGWHRDVTLRHDDLAALLFEWLTELVYWKDRDGVVYHDAQAAVTECPGQGWELTGRIIGDPVNPTGQELRGDVKAITKHLYRVERSADGRWRARVVLDL